MEHWDRNAEFYNFSDSGHYWSLQYLFDVMSAARKMRDADPVVRKHLIESRYANGLHSLLNHQLTNSNVLRKDQLISLLERIRNYHELREGHFQQSQQELKSSRSKFAMLSQNAVLSDLFNAQDSELVKVETQIHECKKIFTCVREVTADLAREAVIIQFPQAAIVRI